MRARGRGRHSAVFTVSARPGAAGKAQLKALADALAPEERGALPGASIQVMAAAGGRVVVRIEADTVKGLRAAVNSHLRTAALALEVAEVAGKAAPPR